MTVKFRAKGKGRVRPKQHKGALTVEQWKQRKSGSKAGKELTGAPTDFAGGKKNWGQNPLIFERNLRFRSRNLMFGRNASPLQTCPIARPAFGKKEAQSDRHGHLAARQRQ
jgi:hypothetical protein